MKILSFFKFFQKDKKEQPEIPVLQKLNVPRYQINFPDHNNPFVPYYRIEGQTEEWTLLPSAGHLYYDPVEDTPEYQSIIKTVDKMVDKEMGADAGKFGSCHKAWSIKKRILKERYGIEWHSVADLNPGCHFD